MGERTPSSGDTVRAGQDVKEIPLTIDDAIRDLLDVSTDIQSVAVLDDADTVVAAGPGPVAADAAGAVTLLWDAAARRAATCGDAPLDHAIVPGESGSVAIVAAHGHRIVAVTGLQPAVGLLLFDLRTCLGDAYPVEDGPR